MTKDHPRTVFLASLFFLVAMVFTLSQTSFGGAFLGSVFDGEGLIGGLQEAEQEIANTGIREETDFVLVIAEVINFVLLFVGIFAVIAFIVAGFLFILGFGSDASIQRAKKIMIWSIVGLVIILFSFVIVNFIVDLATA